jgi:threonine dehydratase
MPNNTPLQKIERVKSFGGSFVKIQLVGQNYDESSKAAKEYAKSKNLIFAHPFDDPLTISGQGTIGLEILDQLKEVANSTPDYVLIAVGGGGLVAGVATAVKKLSKKTKIIAVEVDNQAGMNFSITQNKVTELPEIGTFVDGTAVKKVGELTFKIAKEFVDEFVLVSEGRVCTDMIELYQNEGIIAEPSGALAVSGLSKIADKIKSKKVVCIICGGNNDISRYPEVIEKSLVWKGLKHYFMVNFNQKPGELKKFLTRVLGSKDDIVLFEYIKKTNKEKGVAIVGIQLQDKKDYPALIARLKENQIDFQEIKKDDMAYKILI